MVDRELEHACVASRGFGAKELKIGFQMMARRLASALELPKSTLVLDRESV